MAEKINREIAEKIANLANLQLAENEIENTKEDIAKLLEHIDKLKELDTKNVEPMYQIFLENNRFREDKVTNKDNRENMLKNAPDKEGQSFVVPNTFN